MTAAVTHPNKPPAQAVVEHTVTEFAGFNATAAGSYVSAMEYDKPDAWGDVDIFAHNQFELVHMVADALTRDWEFATDKDSKIWNRWMRFGMSNYRTNTIHLSNGQWDMNLTYKTYEGHPVGSLPQVIETFDWGLLAMGYDLRARRFLDFRSTYFMDYDWNQLPMMDERMARWSAGLIVPYTGIRQAGRYHKYAHTYGYDLTLVKPVLSQGYEIAGVYHSENQWDTDKQTLGQIFLRLGEAVASDDWDTLAEADNSLPVHRDLDDFLNRID
jgi:hypothetical protein